MTLDFETPSLADAPFERPRMVFSFGDKEDSYFIGCGEEMEWYPSLSNTRLPSPAPYVLTL